jgi:UDPglucose--hexose-1-phosphate uridylyltransferase
MQPLYDQLGRRWILLAPERAKRGAPAPPHEEPDPEPCDFCEGHEAKTPPESYAIRVHGTEADTPGWRVRVVPNLYPATAFHEVVIHSPDHHKAFERFEHGMRRAVLLAYRERMRASPMRCTLVIANRGKSAGASRSHDHAQIYGLAHIPPTIERECLSFGEQRCVLCEFTEREDLRVGSADGTTVMAHPAPTMGHELLVVPPHSPSLRDVESDQLGEVADALGEAMRRLQHAFGETLPFNLVIHSAPADTERFHWHAHIYPRLARWGGLEVGAEMPIVASDPQDTARRLDAS